MRATINELIKQEHKLNTNVSAFLFALSSVEHDFFDQVETKRETDCSSNSKKALHSRTKTEHRLIPKESERRIINAVM
ncbi:hypothetical protein DWA37_23360 [Klebsiella pneumoniae]|nr:hypothetical protein DWA37_23360 [Klebsiella pneumoniae]HBY5671519.1 hypothetical protein [Klebsiella pneumoniae]